jgi:putative ABC transport system permease protein
MSNSNNDISYQKNKILADVHTADDTYQKVIGATLLEGRWFGKQDDGLVPRPIVINQTLKEKLFKNESAVNKVVNTDSDNAGERIVGVVADFKDKGDFQTEEASFYRRIDKTNNRWYVSAILIKLRTQQGAEFEAKIHKALSRLMKGANIEIEYLSEKREVKNKLIVIPMAILLIVCSFLVLNVSLGLFGILWHNISRRKSEIGLRRAVGASGVVISRQFIMEAMVLTTLALILGFFFAVQFPLLNVFDVAASVYLLSILLSVLFIYILVLICAFYPGRQAAGIYPAVALHEN